MADTFRVCCSDWFFASQILCVNVNIAHCGCMLLIPTYLCISSCNSLRAALTRGVCFPPLTLLQISVEDQELFQLEGLVKKILAASETVHSMLDDQTGVASHASISATTVTLTADDQAHNGKSSKQHQLIAVSAVAATSD